MTNDIYEQDRFYLKLNQEEVIWIYHNPDAISGDQFVTNIFDRDLFEAALMRTENSIDFDPTVFFDFIGSECVQYCTDIGDYSYDFVMDDFESEPFSIGLNNCTIDQLRLAFSAKDLINEYCMEEFNQNADFTDLKKIGIAYTTTEDDKHEIQVYANLIDYQTELCFDGDLIDIQNSKSLKDYVEMQLPYLDFNELVDIPYFDIEQFA